MGRGFDRDYLDADWLATLRLEGWAGRAACSLIQLNWYTWQEFATWYIDVIAHERIASSYSTNVKAKLMVNAARCNKLLRSMTTLRLGPVILLY